MERRIRNATPKLFLCALLLFAWSCSSSNASTKSQAALDQECFCEPDPDQSVDKQASATNTDTSKSDDKRPSEQAESAAIPIKNSPLLGDASAPIQVVAFMDFQDPFCTRSARVIEELHEKYPEEVVVVFKHAPRAFHRQASTAHEGALAARSVGGDEAFWRMHDKIYDNVKEMRGKNVAEMIGWTARLAEEIGLDRDEFEQTYNQNERRYSTAIERDLDLAERLDIQGVPQFLINGERVKGAKPLSDFEAIIAGQMVMIRELKRAGISREDALSMVRKTHFAQTQRRQELGQKRRERRKRERAKKNKPKVSYVPVEANDPVFGNEKDPLVTIVEFAEFQCPFCKRVSPTVQKIRDNYSDQVRFVFKQYPLPMHQQAPLAAEISLAAGEQGKFWEMHDLLFENQRAMKGKNEQQMIEWGTGLAKQLGLNTGKFRKALESDKFEGEVKEEMQLASKVGARGTPNFWVNGINVVGAQRYSKFEEVIDEQIELAKKVSRTENLSGEELYKKMVELNKKEAGAAAAKQKPSKPAEKIDESKLTLGDAPFKGPDDAPVTIVEFSDFECPYCSRGTNNMMEAVNKFDGKVKVAFKHYPLPFHKAAKPAARAAMAAGEQGKFWEMHDLLFENQKQLKQDGIFVELAEELRLDIAQYKKDMQKSEYDKIIEQDIAQGQKVGVRGTPAFFINGKRLVGAQPTARFEQLIKEELDE